MVNDERWVLVWLVWFYYLCTKIAYYADKYSVA